jgi:exosortase A-associated hydrolase 2
MNGHTAPAALPFFLNADVGERFCLYYQPDGQAPPRGAILYVHPFAEELNKCRRMAALQARAYAQAGYGVLQMDLYGCGDSSGEFADATWDIWLADLARAWQWLLARHNGPLHLWGLRLGGLLALEFATRTKPQTLILWQPVLNGRTYLHQFSRMQSAARLFGSAVEQDSEIAGYLLSPRLAASIQGLDAGALAPSCSVQWLELGEQLPETIGDYAASAGAARASLSSGSARIIEDWRQGGTRVDAYPVNGVPFWRSTEIDEAPELLSVTMAAIAEQR